MKKFVNLSLATAALALILSFGFVSCSDSDDGDDSSSSTTTNAATPTNTDSGSKAEGTESTTTTTTTDNAPSANQGITAVTYKVETDGAGGMTATSETANAGLTVFTSKTGDIVVKTAADSKPKLDSSKYIQFNTSSSKEFDILDITVSADCTATFKINACGNDSAKVYSLDGKTLTKESSYYTQDVSLKKGANTIKGSGVKISSIAFK